MTPSFEETIRTFSAQTYWDALLATGWLNSLPSVERTNLQHSLKAHFERYPQLAWTVLAAVAFDSEGFYSAEDYADLLADFTAGSFGRFTPTRVTVVEDGDLFKISFVAGKQKYEAALSATSDYFDEKLVVKINQALTALNVTEQFILLPSFDQVLHYAFTTPQAIQLAKDRQLIPESSAQPSAFFPTRPSIRDFVLTKAQFAFLTAHVFGDPFVLDAAALQDLDLTEQDIFDAEMQLIDAGRLNNQGDVPPALANFLAATISPGWKWIVQLRSQELEWTQITVNFAESFMAVEALNRAGERLLTQFDNAADMLDWLLNLLPDSVNDKGLSPPQALETLLPQAQTVVTLLIVNTDEDATQAQAMVVWLLAASRLWFVDNQADEEQAVNLTKSALYDRLQDLVNRTIPTQIVRE